LAVTVIAGALSRAEEIALAAEARAYSPERSRSMPIRIGKWDWAILGLGLIGMIAFVLIPG
jgi:energy-coupling factor transporter transmembrane protein EcfT